MEQTKYIREYFKGIRQNALILFAVSIVMLCIASLLFIYIKEDAVYGLVVGLVMLSTFQMLLNLVAYIQSMRKENDVLARCMDVHFLTAEHQRMKKIVPRFPKIRMFQEIFFGLSFISIFLGMAHIINLVSMGMAIAVLVTMAIWIVFDLFAQRRAEEYERRLRRVIEEGKH